MQSIACGVRCKLNLYIGSPVTVALEHWRTCWSHVGVALETDGDGAESSQSDNRCKPEK